MSLFYSNLTLNYILTYYFNILLSRGYKFYKLRKGFCQVVMKYNTEFQKWAIPADLTAWFNEIINSTGVDVTQRNTLALYSFSQELRSAATVHNRVINTQ